MMIEVEIVSVDPKYTEQYIGQGKEHSREVLYQPCIIREKRLINYDLILEVVPGTIKRPNGEEVPANTILFVNGKTRTVSNSINYLRMGGSTGAI